MKSSSVLLSRSFHSLVTNTETQYKYNKNAYITIYFRWQQVVLIVGHLSRINAYHTDRTSHEESQKTFQVCPYPGFLRALLQLSSPLERFCLRNYLQNIVWHSILFPHSFLLSPSISDTFVSSTHKAEKLRLSLPFRRFNQFLFSIPITVIAPDFANGTRYCS